MWIYAFLFIVMLSFSVIIPISNRIHLRKMELAEMNTLFKCEQCGKLHRRYQEELQFLIDPQYNELLTCPSCYHSSKIYIEKEFDWMKSNPACPKLNRHDLKKIKKAMKKSKQWIAEDQSIDKFLHYYKLIQDKKDSPNV